MRDYFQVREDGESIPHLLPYIHTCTQLEFLVQFLVPTLQAQIEMITIIKKTIFFLKRLLSFNMIKTKVDI